jgi:carboxypeptidase C (cathepsin A)
VEGNMRGLDSIPWYGQAAFRAARYHDWYYTSEENNNRIKGGTMKGYDRMWFVILDEAGHGMDQDTPEAAAFIVKQWISGFPLSS